MVRNGFFVGYVPTEEPGNRWGWDQILGNNDIVVNRDSQVEGLGP